jgi:hypothetical protein
MGTAPLQQLVVRDVLVIQKLRQVRLINGDSKFDSGSYTRFVTRMNNHEIEKSK